MASTSNGRLHRGERRVIGGVCSGIAEHFNVDVALVRIVFVVLALMSGGAGFVLYALLWFFLPEAGAAEAPATDLVANGLKSIGTDITRMGEELKKPAQAQK
jgi:phage shock protein PspC (stress-responsive transcriptional regulator)